MKRIQSGYKKKLTDIIEQDSLLAESMEQDNNKITEQIMIHFVLNVIKIVIIIINLSYFLGFIWYIYCDLIIDIHAYIGYSQHQYKVLGYEAVEAVNLLTMFTALSFQEKK